MRFSVRFDEPVAPWVPARTGGRCRALVLAHDIAAVTAALVDCKAEKWRVHVLGCGTRTVFRDGGFDGLVLRLGTGFRGVEVQGTEVTAGAALPVPAVLAVAARHGLCPAPDQLVVPGSFGASVVYEDWDLVRADLARPAKRVSAQVKTVDEVGPRTKGVVLNATVRLEQVGPEEAERRFRSALRRYPVPPGAWVRDARPVREILRRASLERVRLRHIGIPEEAPELLINLGGGTARDLHLLHKSSLERVKRTRGVQLTSTIKWVGTA